MIENCPEVHSGAPAKYGAFLSRKRISCTPVGFKVSKTNPLLYPFQSHTTIESLQRGRSAVFADCGLGKTFIELEWGAHVSAHTGMPVLIAAPLAVSLQTQREGQRFGYDVTVCRNQAHVKAGLNITNYEMLSHFDAGAFGGIILDESSILKSYTGAIRNLIIEMFGRTPYRLACTATPAPNDYMEIGNHAEFLGVMTRAAMLATFFNHDGGETSKWKLKGHAVKPFYDWLSSWSVMGRKPSDFGAFSDEGYILKPITRHIHMVKTEAQEGVLFPVAAETLGERRESRRISINPRVEKACELTNSNIDQWLIWTDLNAESVAASQEIIGAVEVTGTDPDEHKERSLLDFADGIIRRLVTKRKIAGFGMNWQSCHLMINLGLSDSWEAIYQGERRCWRYGQLHPVESHSIITDRDENVLRNIDRKRSQADQMTEELIAAMRRRNA